MRQAFYITGSVCFGLGAIALLDYVAALIWEWFR